MILQPSLWGPIERDGHRWMLDSYGRRWCHTCLAGPPHFAGERPGDAMKQDGYEQAFQAYLAVLGDDIDPADAEMALDVFFLEVAEGRES